MMQRRGADVPGILVWVLLTLPALAGCARTEFTLVTDGFHTRLPGEGETFQFAEIEEVRWGPSWSSGLKDEQVAREAITRWLARRGLVPIAGAATRQVLREEQRFRLQRDGDPIRLDRMPGANFRIAVGIFGRERDDQSLMLRATDIETGVVIWSGSARLIVQRPPGPADLRETELELQRRIGSEKVGVGRVNLLTCYALATAWGQVAAGSYSLPTAQRCD